MKIVIIEDEKFTAEDLAETIIRIAPEADITAVLYSVRESVLWFSKNQHPDLIFSDIQLGDGLCFDIFKTVPVECPVIFCTAYDNYALRAFETNGIDYILKPYDEAVIKASLSKFNRLREKFVNQATNIDQLINLFESRKKNVKSSVLVYKQDKILPVKLENIALFYIENEITYLITFDQKTYSINKTIEEIEKMTPDDFFRINRQIYVNRKAIKEASQYFARKLSLTLNIPFKDPVIVSKLKVPAFLSWLSSH